jgi:hypothetical protein
MHPKRLSVMLAVLMLAAPASRAQEPVSANKDFDTSVASPAFPPGEGRTIVFDEAHRNLHTSAGRYAAVAAVATADGFRVEPGKASFEKASLPKPGLLLIANARGAEKESDPAFATEEVAALVAWVEEGGSLFLIADHEPFGTAAATLAAAFGVKMQDGTVEDAEHQAPGMPGPAFLIFDRKNGLLGRHPILAGRNAAEKVETVVSFGGQALAAKEGIAELLVFGKEAKVQNGAKPVGGLAQLVAFEKGKGRVVIAGEAGLFAAQVITGEAAAKAGVPDPFHFGMTYPGCDNKKLLLNTLRWLARVY